MTNRSQLSESDKIEIVALYKYGTRSARKIGEILNKPKSTVFSFIKRYEKYGVLSPKRGRPTKVLPEIRAQIAQGLEGNPFLSLRDQEVNLPVGKETIRKIRHQEKFDYYEMTPVCLLTDKHIKDRLRYCEEVVSGPIKPIIFTDESTVEINLSGQGIWRRRGHYPPQSFYPKDAHPLHVMGCNWTFWIPNKPC